MMFNVNDYLVYKRDVCQVKEIKEINNEEYYALMPLRDKSLSILVPTNNKMGYIRKIISKEEAEELINSILDVDALDNMDDKYIDKTYKELINNGNLKDLIRIIKTAYLRNENRLKSNKKVSDKDKSYFDMAEEYLYTEMSIALGKSYEDTKNYVISSVDKLVK